MSTRPIFSIFSAINCSYGKNSEYTCNWLQGFLIIIFFSLTNVKCLPLQSLLFARIKIQNQPLATLLFIFMEKCWTVQYNKRNIKFIKPPKFQQESSKKKVFIHDNVYWLIYIHLKLSNIKDENTHRHFPDNIIILHENVLFIAGKT